MPPVELRASLTYNITTFSILKFGRAMAINILTGSWLDLRL